MGILQMSLTASILILAVVAVRTLAIHSLPKRSFLVLWCVVLLRLLLPFTVPMPFDAPSVADRVAGMLTQVSEPDTVTTPSTVFEAPAEADYDPPPVIVNPEGISPIAALWIIGMAGCASFFIVTHLRRRREYRAALPIENEYIGLWLGENKLRRTLQIRQSDRISSPMTYGIWRPVILLPKGSDWEDTDELQYVLAHELNHIKRFDILYKWLLTAALCLHWFNPLVWVMFLLAGRDLELSCDERVVLSFGETAKSAYALTLIRLEEKKIGYSPLISGFSENAIEERINAIMKIKKATVFRTFSALVLVCAMTAGMLFASAAAVGGSSPIEVYDGREKISLTNAPYIQNGDFYLPLRETLNAFGIYDIAWDDGIIEISLPAVDERLETRFLDLAAQSCRFTVGSDTISVYHAGGLYVCNLRNAIVLKDGTTYAPLDFFEEIARRGHMPDFRIKYARSTDPKDYYETGEEVFVGTAQEQNAYNPVDANGNRRLVKRIVLDKNGEVMAVVPIEFQAQEAIAQIRAKSLAAVHATGYENAMASGVVRYDSSNNRVVVSAVMFIYQELLKGGKLTEEIVAYIPPAYQISCFQ